MKSNNLHVFAFVLLAVMLCALISCSSVMRDRSATKPVAASGPEIVEELPPFESQFQNEGRVEYGVPMFNKIPYLNRLFMNTAIGRDGFVWGEGVSGKISDESPRFAVSPDGNWMLQGNTFTSGNVTLFSLFDPKGHRENYIYPNTPGSYVDWMSFTPDSSAFLVYRRRGNDKLPGSLKLHERETGQELRLFALDKDFDCATLSPDGETLFTANAPAVDVWNMSTGQKLGSIPLDYNKRSAAGIKKMQCTPDGRYLLLIYSADSEHGDVQIVDLQQKRQVGRIAGTQFAYSIDCSPDQRTVLVVTPLSWKTTQINELATRSQFFGTRIRFFEVGTWRLLREIEIQDQDAFQPEKSFWSPDIRFSRDGSKLIAFGSWQETFLNDGTQTGISWQKVLVEYDWQADTPLWTVVPCITLPLHEEGKHLVHGLIHDARIGDLRKTKEKTIIETPIK